MYQSVGKRELIFLLSFTCNYVVSVRRGFLFLLVLGIGCVILLGNSLALPYTPPLNNNFVGVHFPVTEAVSYPDRAILGVKCIVT